MSDTTIIYYTDNSLEPKFEKRVQDELVKAADGKRIISVSQKPMDFGDNICIGEIGRSHLSMFKQILLGAQASTTKYVALAEHDCMYTKEHFNWTPPRNDVFFYNTNHWFAQWENKLAGQYSFFRRKAMSQLIANRELFIEAVKEKVMMLETGFEIRKGQPGACEPGVCDSRQAFIEAKARWAKLKDLGKSDAYKAQAFQTELPNIDIRHGKNFSGQRRARQRCWTIPYWGSFHKVMEEVPPEKWYQEATINGKIMPTRRTNDTSEKRWNRYIKPLIPYTEGEGRIFLDLGCNAGFYCRKAVDLGFNSIGVESEFIFLRHAAYWESCEPKGVKIVQFDINYYDIPTASIVLMACLHYWLTPEQLTAIVEKLKDRALYVVIMGRHKTLRIHKSPCDLESLKQTFAGWEFVEDKKGGKHYGALFKNPDLVEKDTEEIFHHQQLAKSHRFLPSYTKLVRGVMEGIPIEMEEDDYYAYLVWRRFKHPDRLWKRHYKLITGVIQNGFIDPFIIGRVEGFEYNENRLIDGDHRYIIARELGIKKIICRQVK